MVRWSKGSCFKSTKVNPWHSQTTNRSIRDHFSIKQNHQGPSQRRLTNIWKNPNLADGNDGTHFSGSPCGRQRLNSSSRVAFDHQIVIIIIKIVFGCRNMKFWPTFASKVTIFNDSGSTFEMSGSGQIEFFSSNGSKILTSQGPGVMALLFGFWAQFGTFFDKSGSEKHPCRCPWRRGNVAPVERNAQGSTPDHPWTLYNFLFFWPKKVEKIIFFDDPPRPPKIYKTGLHRLFSLFRPYVLRIRSI